MSILLVIAVFSVVQSLFGIGLLVFGTPTLILIGYPLEQCLIYLLPSSVMISAMQLVTLSATGQVLGRGFFVWCLPAVLAALVVRTHTTVSLPIELPVAFVLLIGATTTISPTARLRVCQLLQGCRTPYLLAMGAVHGLTNMGGSLLAVYAQALGDGKETILRTIALGYLSFALIQLATIVALRHDLIVPEMALYATTSGLIYRTVGRSMFASTTQGRYRILLGCVMITYSVLLVWRGLHVVTL